MKKLSHVRTRLLMLAIICFSPMTVFADAGIDAELNQLVKQDDNLSSQGDQSLGDSVDLNTGSLSFSQTDVSLPGNSKLEVALKRRLDPARVQTLDQATALAFYNWQIDLPRISATLATNAPWPTNRCSSQWTPPTVQTGGPNFVWFPYEYWHGFKIEFPGGSALLLQPINPFPKPSNFISVAKGNIGISCTTAVTPSGASAGEGFTIWLPDGTHYDMGMFVTATATILRKGVELTEIRGRARFSIDRLHRCM